MNDDARRRAEDFVREVETAMVDLAPRIRGELTADLADHLLEPGDDGTRLIDQDLDPRTYADELRAAAGSPGLGSAAGVAPAEGSRPNRVSLLVGAALLMLVAAGGTWAGISQPWSGSAQPEPTPTSSPTPEVNLVYVPDVRGMSRSEAITALENLGLSVVVLELQEGETVSGAGYLPSGSVAQTEPFAGGAVPDGSEILLFVTP